MAKQLELLMGLTNYPTVVAAVYSCLPDQSFIFHFFIVVSTQPTAVHKTVDNVFFISHLLHFLHTHSTEPPVQETVWSVLSICCCSGRRQVGWLSKHRINIKVWAYLRSLITYCYAPRWKATNRPVVRLSLWRKVFSIPPQWFRSSGIQVKCDREMKTLRTVQQQ